MKKILVFIFFLIIFFLLKNQVLASETCTGTVSDDSANPISDVLIAIQYGNPGINLSTKTDSNGNYSIMTNGFGCGASCINQLTFSKSGYQTLTIDTLSSKKCPGNVTLSSTRNSNQSGFACDLNSGCIQVSSNSQYSNQNACSSDCKQLKYDPKYNSCRVPDTQWHSQATECSQIQVTGTLPPAPTITPAATVGPLPPPCSNPDKNGNCTDIASGLGFPIPTDPAEFVKTIFGIVLSLAGGIAIILIIMSGYALMFSGGNPEKVQSSREQLMAAIIGLLFIIFSMSILQIIGVDILHIPGLIRTP